MGMRIVFPQFAVRDKINIQDVKNGWSPRYRDVMSVSTRFLVLLALKEILSICQCARNLYVLIFNHIPEFSRMLIGLHTPPNIPLIYLRAGFKVLNLNG
jgi:hypothetical protein